MEKSEYIERAPVYYALAIACSLRRMNTPLSEYKIKQRYPETDETTGELVSLLDRGILWDRAVAWLAVRDMVKIKTDPFGPPIFSKGIAFEEQWELLIQNDDLPFSNFAEDGDDWLNSALHSVENHYSNLDIKPEDFENPDSVWEPIQIEGSDPTVEKAIYSLEQIVEEVRSDNGYAASYPHERDYVLEGLTSPLEKLKGGSISAGYVKLAIDRLRILTRRFAGSIKEATILAAKQALIEFAKKHFGDALNYVWKFFF